MSKRQKFRIVKITKSHNGKRRYVVEATFPKYGFFGPEVWRNYLAEYNWFGSTDFATQESAEEFIANLQATLITEVVKEYS